MKKQFLYLLLSGALFFFTACQKEVSFESKQASPSAGSLQRDASGECLPKTVQGAYTAGTTLDSSINFIDVQVDVTTAGSYRVYSDTINGIYFEARGTFTQTGLITVRIGGSGTPTDAGTHNFTLTYDSTICTVAVSTLGTGGGTIADFTLLGAPDTCSATVVSGDYIVGVAMTPANTAVINVNVNTPGTYNISTNTSNGLTFSGSGSLTSAGSQTITLSASGTPAIAGSTNIPVTIGTSTCSFYINVTGTPQAVDYFPLTASSNWSYQFNDDPNDSLLVRAKPGTVNLGGKAYTVFEGTFDAAGGFQDFGFYRKNGSDYYNYVDVGYFFGFDDPQNTEFIFLKDNLNANSTWQTPGFDGTVTDSTGTYAFTIRIVFTIEQKDVTINIGGVAYPNTIVVAERYEILNGSAWLDATPVLGFYKSYYSRNIGLIKQESYYEEGNPAPTFVDRKQDIRRYQVL